MADLDSSAPRTADWRWAAGVILVLWTALFLWGQPLSFVDDRYFIGAGINLAAGHGFDNPFCVGIRTIDPQPEFFTYMPMHSYVLAGWLSLFGVSRFSLALFHCLAGALATLGLWRFTFRPALPWWYCVALVLVVAVYLGSLGLRPEALGLALFSWGLFLPAARSNLAWTLGCVALFAACISSPNFGPLVPLVLGWALYRSWTGARADLLPRFLLAGAALAVVLALFLVMIHGELPRFLHVFNEARTRGSEGQNGFLSNLHGLSFSSRARQRLFFQALFPLLGLLAVLAVAVARPGLFIIRTGLVAAGMVLLGELLLYSSALSSAAGLRLPGFYSTVAILFFACCLRVPWRYAGLACWLAFFGLFILAIGHRSIQLALLPPQSRAAQAAEIKATLERLQPAHIYVDEFADHVIFDYRLPPNATDYHFGLAGLFAVSRPGDFPPGSTLVVSKETLWQEGVLSASGAGDQPRMIPVVGSLFPMEIADPYDCVVLQTPLTR